MDDKIGSEGMEINYAWQVELVEAKSEMSVLEQKILAAYEDKEYVDFINLLIEWYSTHKKGNGLDTIEFAQKMNPGVPIHKFLPMEPFLKQFASELDGYLVGRRAKWGKK